MTYARRKRLRELAEREAAGEDLWTQELDEEARRKLLYASQTVIEKVVGDGAYVDVAARRLVLRDTGWDSLAGYSDSKKDIAAVFMQSSNEAIFSYLEMLLASIRDVVENFYHDVDAYNRRAYEGRLPGFVATIKTVLREHWLEYDLVDGQFVDLKSKELHEEVVGPAVTLLGVPGHQVGDSRLAGGFPPREL